MSHTSLWTDLQRVSVHKRETRVCPGLLTNRSLGARARSNEWRGTWSILEELALRTARNAACWD